MQVSEGKYVQGSLSRPRLVRLLGDLAAVEVETPRQDFAERLGLWLNALDAVRLDGALQSIKALAPQKPANSLPAAAALAAVQDALQRTRTALAAAITAASTGLPGHEEGYGPYHRRHADQQRQMELKVGQLRAQVRQTVSKASPALRQLATLDAVMEQMLAAREQKLLSSAPVFLERRFRQWREAEAGAAPEGFAQEWREVLLAELDLRLQPVVGLMEALGAEPGTKP